MIKVGVTGGIGTGKTTVCRIFETLGVPVFYADDEAKKILFTDANVLNSVIGIFGEEIFSAGIPDRKKIADIIFTDAVKLQQLNSVLHPETLRHFNEWCDEKKIAPYVLMEAALIFETGAENFLDFVIVISAPEKIRINRTTKRNHLTEEEVKARIKHQFSPIVIEQKADFIIVNDEEQLLIPQVMALHENFMHR